MSDTKAVDAPPQTMSRFNIKIIPAGIVRLHAILEAGDGDYYGERMFAVAITPEMEAFSPILQDGTKAWLIYRRKT